MQERGKAAFLVPEGWGEVYNTRARKTKMYALFDVCKWCSFVAHLVAHKYEWWPLMVGRQGRRTKIAINCY